MELGSRRRESLRQGPKAVGEKKSVTEDESGESAVGDECPFWSPQQATPKQRQQLDITYSQLAEFALFQGIRKSDVQIYSWIILMIPVAGEAEKTDRKPRICRMGFDNACVNAPLNKLTFL
jgi:hypothetical protein